MGKGRAKSSWTASKRNRLLKGIAENVRFGRVDGKKAPCMSDPGNGGAAGACGPRGQKRESTAVDILPIEASKNPTSRVSTRYKL